MTAAISTFCSEQLTQALAYHKQDQLDEAINIYDCILENHPDHEYTLHAKGIALAQLGKYKPAMLLLNKAVTLAPENTTFLASLGNCQRHLGLHDLALASFSKALEITPSIAAYINIGVLHYALKEYATADDFFTKALKIHPNSVHALFNLALCKLHSGYLQEAKLLLEKTIKIDSSHQGALSQLGKIYLSEQALLLAKNCYHKLLNIQPRHAEATAQLGLIYLQMSDDKQGLDLLEKAYKLDDSIEAIEHNLACVYLHRRRYEDALKHWLQYLKHDPVDTHYNIGVCYLYMGRYAEAGAHFQHMLEKHPQHHATLVNLGACHLQQNQKDKSIAYYQQAQKINPQSEIEYLLAALQNQATHSQAPVSYVTDLFNQYANNYDNHLTNVLSYRVPHALHQIITRVINPAARSMYCIDIGCGTGLVGEVIDNLCHRLVGIDIADNMLDKAREKNIYTKLVLEPLPDALKTFTAVDIIVAGDFFPYVGSLDATFTSAFNALRPGGWLVFSTEKSYEPEYHLQDNARFAHNFNYVCTSAEKTGFLVTAYESAQLRTQQRDYVEGLCYILQRPI